MARWAYNSKGRLERAEVVALREAFEREQGQSQCVMGPYGTYICLEIQDAWNDYRIAHGVARRTEQGHILPVEA